MRIPYTPSNNVFSSEGEKTVDKPRLSEAELRKIGGAPVSNKPEFNIEQRYNALAQAMRTSPRG